MKNKRLLLVLIFAVVILAGWIFTLRTISGTDIIEEQNSLVSEADIYKDKELYVRAIPLYEKAVKLDTDSNDEIEQKLLYCYENYGDTSSYIELVEKRDAAGTAQEQEYLTAASYYIEKSKLSKAMELIKSGIEKLGSQALTEYFEDNRYAYSVKSTKYVDIIPTKNNDVMPAYDGEKWGYINSSGKVLLKAQYDTATVFDTKYELAVVSNDGQYYVITSEGDKYGVDDGVAYPQMTDVKTMTIGRVIGQRNGTYSYYNYDFEPLAENYQFDEITSNSCGVAAVRKGDKWGIITDGGATVVDFILDDVAVNSYDCVFVDDIAMVKENGSWHMIDVEGNTVGTATFADAKAPESSGYIAVADSDGKWGFADREGNLVIDYTYFDAYSFSNGLAAVQTAIEWGYISERNELVIDSLFEWAKPFHDGIAQAKIADYVQLINLKYYEE